MEFEKLVASLDRFGRILPALVADLSDSDAKWKPDAGGWSILEVVCHLADEEVEDFRLRVQSTLSDPSKPWPKIDPEATAVERNYNEQNLAHVVERFVRERNESVDWLKTLEHPDWDIAYQHPKFGSIAAGLVMASWAAHDQLHLRQIAKRMFEMNVRDGAPYPTDYAGEWKA